MVSPSWGGAGAFPHRVERGMAQLQRMGFRVRLGRHAREQRGFVSASAEDRLADLHELFDDPEVRLVLAAVGGDHACHLLPLLDFARIARQPKLVMGFSDMTVLNVAIWQQTGLTTFNGPALLTDFAESPEMFPFTRDAFLAAVAQAAPIGALAPSPWWTEEFLDWGEQKDLERPRQRQPSTGWVWLKPGRAEGRLLGGCLESLQHLRGTKFWPDWTGAIFFWETSENAPDPATVDGMLMDYQNMGVLAQLSGMLVGRPMRYSETDRAQLREVILDRTRAYDFPIVTDLDFGHTAPQLTLPIGCQARIDAAARRVEILESAVAG